MNARPGWLDGPLSKLSGVALAVALLASASVVRGQGQEVHGGDSVFAARGVALAWGVLKAAAEAETLVIIRVASGGGVHAYLSVEAVDPFSGKRRAVEPGRPLADTVDVRSPRITFADFPRREIHFYRTPDDWRAARPSLTVYYLGVPDTTPEFTSEAALSAYLADALARASGGPRAP